MNKFLLAFLALFSVVSAQKKLTLDEATTLALQRNSNLIISKNNLSTSEAALKNAYGALLPNFGIRGSWDWNRTADDGGGFLRNEFGVLVPISKTEVDSRSFSLSAGGSVVLFDGLSNYANISEKQDNIESSKFEIAKLKQDIIYQTSELFYTVLKAKELLKVRDENLKYNQKFLEDIEERNKLGAVTLADVYAQQVQLGTAELQYLQTENLYETSKSNLLDYLALNVLEEYDFIDPFDSAPDVEAYMSEFDTIENLVNTALQNRDDYKSTKLNLKIAESGVTRARSGFYPSLSADYGFGTVASEVGKLFDRKTYSFGLSINLPIFSNWSTEYSTELAKVNVLNATEGLNVLERQIKIEIKQGYLQLNTAKKALEVSKKTIIAAGETRKLINEKYSLGSGTILEVLQADNDFMDAQRSLIEAEYEFYRLKDNLLRYLGKLNVKNLIK
ncbi:MAG: TolC family protein [Ignavibacteriales bacterium]|nr:TolC family protein [Ignavibacteriales bacterium]MCF8314770.1 TolC family protein [Ignavibacteriales bacterium]MCF8437982.1 TolC family protein [Ignavibacteriales bacterium]